jgi:hypothetical protein
MKYTFLDGEFYGRSIISQKNKTKELLKCKKHDRRNEKHSTIKKKDYC